MARLDDLYQGVEKLYTQKLDSRDDWADWLYPNHVVPVTENAKRVAERVGADVELSQAAALLHDIADATMHRTNPDHEAESLKIARELMQKHGYTEDEIALIVDDAIRYHSCHGGERPASKEGLVLATADSLAHLQTDFYFFAAWGFGASGRSLEDLKAWALKKIDRDLNSKISFDEIREEARPDYEALKRLLSR
jgi:putative nucleotidyltransferase with HDIG domain